MAAETILTEKMRAALRISSKNAQITEEINDCIAACKADLKDVGVVKLDETDALIVRAITLYVKAEFGFNDKADKFKMSYDCLKTHLSMSSDYIGAGSTDEPPDITIEEAGEQDVKDLFS